MFTKSFITVASLAVAASAIPMAKRDIVYLTETSAVIQTVAVTQTVWVNAESSAEPTPTHYRHGHGHGHEHGTTAATTVAAESAAPSSSVEEVTSSSVYVAPTSSTTEEAAPTSTYVAPTTSSTSQYVAPTTSSTSEYVAPTTTEAPSTTSVAPAPTSYQTAAATSAAASSGGAVHTGDITYWTPALGSCGTENTASEAVVALPANIMTPKDGDNPNDNPLCGSMITITYQGSSHQAKVVDTCMGCEGDSIDLSPSLFKAVAPNGDGRVHGVSWTYNN